MSKRRAHRKVSGLLSASPIARPKCIPRSRPRGVRALGLRFERALARALPTATHGQWWEYEDSDGHGYCQTDILLPWDGGFAILECKLTDTEAAREQLEELYLPVVRKALRKPVTGIIVTRHLTRTSDLSKVHDSLGLALIASRTRIPVFHWLGVGALDPQVGRSGPSPLVAVGAW